MTSEGSGSRRIERRLLLRTLGAGALASVAGRTAGSDGERPSGGNDVAPGRDDRSARCVVDDFEDGDLDEYVARDGPKDSWAVVPFRGGSALRFRGGDAADLQSYGGLGTYPRRGDRFSLLFYPTGDWAAYAMFSFGIADPETFQRRYELEFVPAESEVRLQYSRGPRDETTIARASSEFVRARRLVVDVNWAASSDDLVVTVTGRGGDRTTLRAPEPDGAPTGGGIGFYGTGDAAWTFDRVTVADCDDRRTVDDFEDGDLDEYVARDGPKANWAVRDLPDHEDRRALQFQGGDGADLQSFSGLPAYPRRGDRIQFDFGTLGNWNGYAMVSFGIADPETFQRRYELEFEPAESELRLQYSRGPRDEATIAATTADLRRDRFYDVTVDWATAGDEIVVEVEDAATTVATLRAPEPDGAPVAGGVGFYAFGDAAWAFDAVRLRRRDGGGDDGNGGRNGVGVVDDFEDGDLDEYVARDGPKSNWAVVDSPAGQGRRALQFQGGDGADLQSFSGLPRYPRRGDRFRLDFGTLGDWNGYAMVSFGIADPDQFQRRYELEFVPAERELRLQYSRAPRDETTVARAAFDVEWDRFYDVTVDWAASSDDVVVEVVDGGSPVATLRAPEPATAPAGGGIGFYAFGDAAWAYDDVRILDRTGSDRGWPTIYHDAANTGASRTGRGPTEGATEAWSAALAADWATTIAVVGDTVYATGNEGLVALDAATGQRRWTYEIVDGAKAPPTVHDGTVYLIGSDRHGHAVDAATGKRRWRTEFPDSGAVAPAVAGDTAFFGHFYGQVEALDAATGTRRFSVGTGDLINVKPAVADDVIYVTGNPHGSLLAASADAGDVRWRRFEFDSGWVSAPTVANGVLYVGVDTNNDVPDAFYALDAADGTTQWTFDAEVQRSPAVADGTVYAPTTDGRLVALDADDGSVAWRRTLDEGIAIRAPSVVGDVVYVPDSTGTLHALNASDGSHRWQYQAPHRLAGAPAAVDGTLYVTGTDDRVYALEDP